MAEGNLMTDGTERVRAKRLGVRLNQPRPGAIVLSDGSYYPCQIINKARRGAHVICAIPYGVLPRFVLIDRRAGTKRSVQVTRREPGKICVKYLDGRLSGNDKLARTKSKRGE